MKNKNCVVCKKETKGNATCSRACLIKLRSLNGTRLHKEGVSKGWNDRNR